MTSSLMTSVNGEKSLQSSMAGNEMNVLDGPFLAPFSFLTFENLQKLVSSKQCFQKGYDIVKCGDVWDLKSAWKEKGAILQVSGWVHSEKTAAVFYRVSIEISRSSLLSYECPCKGCVILASTNTYQLRKHPVAILVALEAIRNSSHENEAPKRFRRIGMRVFKGAPERVREKVEVDLTWPMIIDRFSTSYEKK